jgi:hypothetical protein
VIFLSNDAGREFYVIAGILAGLYRRGSGTFDGHGEISSDP